MHRSHNALAVSKFAILGVAILLFTAGCGGGGGGGGGDTHGTDTPASISHIDQILGIQGTLYADPNGYVTINYHLQDGQYDNTDVEIQYGIDRDGSNQIEDTEYAAATPAPGSEGTVGLNSSPGGAAHSFIWHSVADIDTNRYVTTDFEYTADGRQAVDAFGDVIYRAWPGVKFRIRPILPNADGVWRYTDAFAISNNHPPEVTSFLESDVVIPPEGVANTTVNEIVNLLWKVKDEDSDPVTIAVDWLLVDFDTFDPAALTPEEIEGQPWQWATSAPLDPPLSEGTANLPANPTDTQHGYGWDSVDDAGTENTGVWLRIRPIDGKNEVGDWVYMDKPFHLNNFAIFTELDPMADTRLGARATLLTNGNVLLTGGRSTDSDPADDTASIFYPTNQTQTLSGSTAPITDGMQFARAGHTATRLFRQDDPNDATKLLDAKVLVVGGLNGSGDPQDTAEIYDPATPAGVSPFSSVASMNTPRTGHFAILLSSGKVLVGGGVDDTGTVLKSAEIYDPVDDSWTTVTTDMGEARTDAQAVLLPGLEGSQGEDGFILVAGGNDGTSALGSIEVFDVLALEFQNMGSGSDMNSDRTGLSLTPTLDDTWAAVAAGGEASPPTASIERYNQQTESWTTSSVQMGESRSGHLGLLQGDGTILLCGGVMDAQGNFAATAELYDPDRDTIRLTNGLMREAVSGAPGVVLTNGRTVIFGGDSETGAQDFIQAWTPETETGFNTPPTVQIKTPTNVEPWAFGVRIYYRCQDTEGDDVRIVAQFKVKESATDATADGTIWTQAMKDKYLDRWRPAAMQVQTVLGDKSSGSSGLEARKDVVSQSTNPIDNPDDPNAPSDLGEHLFVWKTSGSSDPVTSLEAGGLPKGDYNNVYFRIIVYGATEGGVATTGSFGMTKNAPVICRVQPPIEDAANGDKVYGNVVIPFYLQDSDDGEHATLTWEFGKDLNNDGKIVEGQFVPGLGTEGWVGMTMADQSVTVSLNGQNYTNPAAFHDIQTSATGYVDPATNIPWGVKGHFVWNATNDVGSPVTGRSDLIVRCTPYDYPNAGDPTTAYSLGIGSERGGWTLESDPNGLYLDSWSPTVNTTPDPGVFEYTGVGTNEPIEFNFTKNVTNVNSTTLTISEKGSTTPVPGVFVTVGSTVTWYPQVDELPHPVGILKPSTDYQITMYGWDPLFSGRDVIHAAGANTADTNAYNLLHDGSSANAFQTGTGAYQESVNPSYTSPLVTPSSTTGVSTSLTKIEMKFDEFLDPATVNHTNFEVYIDFAGGKSVVPGVFSLENRTNATTGVQTGVLIYTFVGTVDLPKGATVQVRAKTALKDLYGNSLSAEAAPSFTTIPSGGAAADSWTESFNNTTYRDYDATTVWWGNNDPKVPGDFSGYGTAGEVSGLFDFGSGINGSFYGSGTWTSTSSDNVRQFTSFTVPYGYTLTLRGTHPWTIRCTGAATIGGTINASGSTGGGSVSRYTTGSGSLAAGGAGGSGGGQGSSAGYWTANAKTPITYNNAKNYLGVTSGTGVGGSGVGIFSTWTYYPRFMAGGGGAGHAAAGTTGYHGYGNAYGYYPNGGYRGMKGGAGGAAYGNKEMTAGPQPGSGGGSGGTRIYGITTNNYFVRSGAGGGGGGGVFRLIAANGIDLQSTGRIWAKGGNGGNASYGYRQVGSYYVYIYPGGGGAGSGGTVDLQSSTIKADGEIDVSGGAGGTGAYTYSSFNGSGGDGGGGRVRLAMSGSVWLVNAVVSSGAATIACGGGGTSDWTVSSNTTVNTTSGSGGVGWNSSSKQFRVKNFTVNSGATLTVTGTNPFVVLATGDVSLKGNILAAGGDGNQRTSYDYTGSTSQGWYHYDWYRTNYTYYQGSPTPAGGPGGGTGGGRGAKSTYSNSYGYYHLPTSFANPLDGGGWNSSTGTSGAGRGGRQHSTGYRRYQYTKYYYYYYYGGAGGGGASVLDGKVGVNPYAYSGYRGTPGAGGTANFNIVSSTPATVRGGAGGGGGVMGGIYITTYNYRYCRGGGDAGGGGGGAIGICAEGTIHIDANIDVSGGMGGSQLYTYYYYTAYDGAGGGGGGGNVRMHAKGGFTFGAPSIDCGGGVGGRHNYYTSPDTNTPYCTGGEGGKGGLHLTAPTDPKDTTMPTVALSASGLKLGTGGTLHVAPFAVSDTAVSTFYDTETMIPTFTTANTGWGGTGLKDLWVEGAMAQGGAASADTGSGTGWIKLYGSGGSFSNITQLNGYRFVRFKLTINAGASVTSVSLGWTYP